MDDPYLPDLPVPEPAPDGVDAEFFAAARQHALAVQRCRDCGRFQVPAEFICHRCHSHDLGWERVEPRGRIYSWMRVHHPSHPALRDRVPYLVVVVEVAAADDVKMVGNLLGDPGQEVEIGAAVDAVFEDRAEGQTLVQWRRA